MIENEEQRKTFGRKMSNNINCEISIIFLKLNTKAMGIFDKSTRFDVANNRKYEKSMLKINNIIPNANGARSNILLLH